MLLRIIFLLLDLFLPSAHARTPGMADLKENLDRTRQTTRDLLSEPGIQGIPLKSFRYEFWILGGLAQTKLKRKSTMVDRYSQESIELQQDISQSHESQWIGLRYGWKHLFLAFSTGRNLHYQRHFQDQYFEENTTKLSEIGLKTSLGHTKRIGKSKISLIAYRPHLQYGQIQQLDRGPRFAYDLKPTNSEQDYNRLAAGIDLVGRLYFSSYFGMELNLRAYQSSFSRFTTDQQKLTNQQTKLRRDILINDEKLQKSTGIWR